MATYTLRAQKSNLLKNTAPAEVFNTETSAVITQPYMASEVSMLVGFEPVPEELYYKKLVQLDVYCYVTPTGRYGNASWPFFGVLENPFDEETATFAKFGEGFRDAAICPTPVPNGTSAYARMSITSGYSFENEAFLRALANGVRIWAENAEFTTSTSRGSQPPYATLNYEEDASFHITRCSPSDGYLPKASANIFSWDVVPVGLVLGELSHVPAVFRYKSAENGEITEIDCGESRNITVPGGTFTGDDVFWQVRATPPVGPVIESDWYKLTTVEVTSTATALSPSGAIADGNGPITFRWRHEIATGSAPTGFELQTGTDGVSFTLLASGEGPGTEYEAPGGTFVSGDIWWRVRTLNSQGAAGAWSDPARFVSVASPPTPVVSVKGVSPMPLVTWQGTDQQAFEVTLGAWQSGHRFGSDKELKCGEYLEDGYHTATVRVQNKYGLWSEAGAVGFTVQNAPGEVIDLEVSATHNAVLTWSGEVYEAFYVYRDGVPIAKTGNRSYTDNTSLGQVNYMVRGVLPEGNYTLSRVVTVTVRAPVLMIADLEAGRWRELRLSEVQSRETGTALSREVAYMSFSGQRYPSAELTEFYSKALSFTAAFSEETQSADFESLLGRLVCVKAPRGEMAIGVLEAAERVDRQFYTAFSATVTQIHYPEAVEYD